MLGLRMYDVIKALWQLSTRAGKKQSVILAWIADITRGLHVRLWLRN